jgi:hypothetical protein
MLSQAKRSSDTPQTNLRTLSLLPDSLESQQVQLLHHVRTFVRFHSVNHKDHVRSSQGGGDNPVAPPRTILQLQSLQGKANFLRRFIANYAEITKGFMHLLKKDVPFLWDEAAQCSFDTLKHALTTAPLLQPPNYNKDFLFYLAAAESTIGMVLVQEDDSFSEYVIYYLS